MPTSARISALCLIGALVLACGGPPSPTSGGTPTQELADLGQRAVAAYEAHDYRSFLRHTQEVLARVPEHPRWLYNLACGYALTGEPEAALATLARLVDKGLYFDLAAEADFAALRGEPGYGEIVRRFESLLEPVVRSREAFRAGPPDLIPEGIAYDAVSGAFFLGSVRRGAILRVRPDAGGGATVETFAAGGQGLGSVLGMAVDAKRRTLWAVTTALPQLDPSLPPPRYRNALVGFDLNRAGADGPGPSVVYEAPEGSARSLNDLAIAPDGTVVVSDAGSGALFRRRPDGEDLEVLWPPGTFRSPQGLAFSADGSRLWLADYSGGLFLIHLKTHSITPLGDPANATLLGIDGLSRAGGDLIAIQNGVRPHRVLRLGVDEDAAAVTSVEILEKAHPAYQEPTLGVVVGDELFYVANSQWNRFDPDGHLPPAAELVVPLVLRLPLEER